MNSYFFPLDGILCIPSQIDFGTIAEPDVESKVADLQLFNGTPEIVEITDVTSNDRTLMIDFVPVVLPPFSNSDVARISFRGIFFTHFIIFPKK